MSGVGVEKPAFLLAGGRQTSEAEMARLISLAFGAEKNPRVAYIGAANSDNVLFFGRMKSFLMRAGAKRVDFVRLAKEKIDLGSVKTALSSSDVIFLSGGEVEDGMLWLKRHGLADYLKELYFENRQFVGVSAGTIMMGAHWVRWEDPDRYTGPELFNCLGIIPAIFDTHAEDEDWIELKAALTLCGDGERGYGVAAGGLVCADSRGMPLNVAGSFLTYVNDNGVIRAL